MTTLPTDLQAGDWGVVRGPAKFWTNVAAAAVEMGTDSEFCHAVTYTGAGRTIEANPRDGVHYGDATRFGDRVEWSTGKLPTSLTPTPGQRAGIVADLMTMIGWRYADTGIVAIALNQLRVAGPQSLAFRLLQRQHEVFCSQLVDIAQENNGIHLFTGRPAGEVSPESLAALLTP